MCASFCSARRGIQCQKGQRDTAGGEEDDRCWGKGKDNTVSDGVTKKRGGKAHNRRGQLRKRVQGRIIPSPATFNYTSGSAEEVGI